MLRNFSRLLSNKYVVTACAFLVWMAFFDHNDLISQWSTARKLSGMKSDKAYYEHEIARVKKERDELMTNKATLEKFAREKYNMKRDGEDLFIIVRPQSEEGTAETSTK